MNGEDLTKNDLIGNTQSTKALGNGRLLSKVNNCKTELVHMAEVDDNTMQYKESL